MASAAASTPQRLLIVDDNPAQLRYLQTVLAPFLEPDPTVPPSTQPCHLWRVTTAQNATQALELARTAYERGQPFDVALVDLHLGAGMDGRDLARQLWAIDTALPLGLMVNYEEPGWDQLDQFTHRARVAILKKPCEDAEIRLLLQLLGRYRQLQARAEECSQEVHQAVVQRTRELERTRIALTQLSEELMRARNDAEAAANAKSAFLATMSHEIRTPMNGVIGMTELLLDSPLSATQQEYVRTIQRSGEALLTIINDVLDYSRIEAGALRVEQIEFSPREVLDDVLELLAVRAEEKNLVLAGWADASVPDKLQGDPGRVRQILTNLVGNAIKFTERGHVQVELTAQRGREREMILRGEVIDTGIGIAPEVLKKLFQSFVQADNTTTRRFGGTGLGLAISRQLVQLMGGQIGVDSKPDVGSRFWFTVMTRPVRGQEPVRPSYLPVRALAVVQQELTRRSLRHSLTHLEVSTVEVDSLEAAQTRLREAQQRQEAFDLVLLDDAIIPDQSQPVVQQLLQDVAERPPALALLSAVRMKAHTELSCPSFLALLTKPVRTSALREVLYLLHERDRGSAEMAPAGPAAHRPGSDQNRPRVLVVDDDETNRRLLARQYEHAGALVCSVSNGAAAVAQAQQQTFDLVLVDQRMPEMDGLATTTALRQAPGVGSRALVLGITADSSGSMTEAWRAVGVDQVLVKPIRRQHVEESFQQWLARAADSAAAAPDSTPTRCSRLQWKCLQEIYDTSSTLLLRGVLAALEQGEMWVLRMQANPTIEEEQQGWAHLEQIGTQLGATDLKLSLEQVLVARLGNSKPQLSDAWADVTAHLVSLRDQVRTRLADMNMDVRRPALEAQSTSVGEAA